MTQKIKFMTYKVNIDKNDEIKSQNSDIKSQIHNYDVIITRSRNYDKAIIMTFYISLSMSFLCHNYDLL